MVAIKKLSFLVASCLALASTYVRDDRPTPLPSYYGLPLSPSQTNSAIIPVLSSDSLSSSFLKTVESSLGPHSSTSAFAIRQSHIKSISITATHNEEAAGGHKTLKETSTKSISRKSTLSTIHSSLTLATHLTHGLKGVPSNKDSSQSEKTSVVSQSHLKTNSRPNVSKSYISKSYISSVQPPKFSVDHTQKSTMRASQSKVTGDSSRTGPTAMMTEYSTKQKETATSITRIRSTGVRTKPSTHTRIPQPLRTSVATKKPTKQSTSFLSRSKGKSSSSVPGHFRITKASTSNPLKIVSTTTSSSEQRSTVPSSQKLPNTGTNPKSQLSSVKRETSFIATKNIDKTASGNSPSFTLGRTNRQETASTTDQIVTHSAISQNSTTSATTRHPVSLTPTRSRALPAPTKKHTSTTTATAGQPASIPRSTATKTTSRPVEITVTGSKGIVATYVATQDPKYTTNRKTITTTDDHRHDIIIFPGGWRWIPIGLPPLRLPSPPKLNPDPHDHDNHGGNDDGHSEDHRTSHSKWSTSSARCITTTPPECTKTVSFVTGATGFKR